MKTTSRIQSPELRTGRKNESDSKRNFGKTGNRDGGDWVILLPFALFRVHNTPYKLNLEAAGWHHRLDGCESE